MLRALAPPAMVWRSGCRVALLGSAISVLASGCGPGGQAQVAPGPPPVAVQVAQVVAQPLPRTLEAVGTLSAPEQTTISAEMDAQIVAIEMPEGERVEQGQILVRLDAADPKAALARARAQLQNARQRKQRLESLRASSVSSEQAYEDAVAAYDMALAEFRTAQASLGRTEIRAPFSGVLGLSLVTPGQYVKSGHPIVSLTRVHPLEMMFSIPQEQAPELAVGQSVLGSVGRCVERFEGTVRAIEPQVDRQTRSVRVKALVPNEDGRLWAGMAARVRVVVDQMPDALLIPQEAVIRQGARYLVYVIDAQGVARQRPVELGTFFVDRVHVRSGLSDGDRVVAAGHQKLRPGSPTQSQPYEPVRNPTLELGWFGPREGC